MERALTAGDGERATPGTIAALAAVLCLALALRLIGLAHESIWADEAFTWWWVQQPLAGLWGAGAAVETNPPLYYTVAWLGVRLLGDDEAALRLPSALIGTLGVAAIYLLGRLVGGRRVGLVAALLTAICATQVFYSQQARGYALLSLLGTLSVLGSVIFFRAATPPAPRPRAGVAGLALYALSTAGALYAHNTAALLPVVLNLVALGWWLACSRRWATAGWWVAANFLILLAWSWWLPVLLAQMGRTDAFNLEWLKQPSVPLAVHMLVRLYGLSFLPNSTLGQFLPGLFVFGIALLALVRHRDIATITLAAVAVGIPALLFLLGFAGQPLWSERTYFWPLPLGLILVARLIVPLRPPWLRGTVLAVVLAIGLANLALFRTHRHKDDYRAAIARIEAARQPGDAILFMPRWAVMGASYYLARRGIALDGYVIDPVGGSHTMGPPYDTLPLRPPIFRQPTFLDLAELARLAADYHRVWVLSFGREGYDPNDAVRGRLAELGREVSDEELSRTLALTLFEFPGRGAGAIPAPPSDQPAL